MVALYPRRIAYHGKDANPRKGIATVLIASFDPDADYTVEKMLILERGLRHHHHGVCPIQPPLILVEKMLILERGLRPFYELVGIPPLEQWKRC